MKNELVKCIVCHGEMEKICGNYGLKVEGIEVFIIGSTFYQCSCGQEQLPDSVAQLVTRLVKEKKEKHPDSPPWLYINLL